MIKQLYASERLLALSDRHECKPQIGVIEWHDLTGLEAEAHGILLYWLIYLVCCFET